MHFEHTARVYTAQLGPVLRKEQRSWDPPSVAGLRSLPSRGSPRPEKQSGLDQLPPPPPPASARLSEVSLDSYLG